MKTEILNKIILIAFLLITMVSINVTMLITFELIRPFKNSEIITIYTILLIFVLTIILIINNWRRFRIYFVKNFSK